MPLAPRPESIDPFPCRGWMVPRRHGRRRRAAVADPPRVQPEFELVTLLQRMSISRLATGCVLLLVVGCAPAADSFAPAADTAVVDEPEPESMSGSQADGVPEQESEPDPSSAARVAQRPGTAAIRASGGTEPPESESSPLSVADPVKVEIPAIGVASELVDLGLNEDRTLEVPSDPDLAGWYTGRPPPGAIGPAIIAGHVDSYDGPAVFYRVRDLAPGDDVLVHRADGSTARFTVDRVEQHPKDDFPTGAVYGPTDEATLRLITCGGPFDRRRSSYDDNIVVYATLETP